MNYDAQQIYSLLSTYIKRESLKRSQVASDAIIQGWKNEIEEQKILRIEKIITDDGDQEDEPSDASIIGYDSLMNSNCDENFVVSLSTDREEICVWNVLK